MTIILRKKPMSCHFFEAGKNQIFDFINSFFTNENI